MKPSIFRKFKPVLLIIFLMSMLVWSPVPPARAASLVVTTAADSVANDGSCSLREAIANANHDNGARHDCTAGSGQDTISFAPGITTIVLNHALPNIMDSDGLTVDGGGSVTISGAGSAQVFLVNDRAALTLTGLTISDGNAGSGFGGAVFNRGTLVIRQSRFTGNTARFGGVILSWGGSTSIDTSTFSQNRGLEGGGTLLFTGSGTHTVANSLLVDNICSNPATRHGSGGGIQAENETTVILSNVTLANNLAGGTADDGGGGLMVYGGTVAVVNSTLYGNISASVGGGIRQLGGTVTLRNTIVSSSTRGGNCYGTVTDGSGNLVWGDATCPGRDSDPHLEALADNGGSTQSMALGAGSAAINLAAPGYCPATDQRGFPRRSGFCDAGAFEAQPATVTAASGTPQSTATNTPFPAPLEAVVRDIYDNLLGGVTVTYTAPASGASAVLSNSTAATSSSGLASVTATANDVTGAYTVAASVNGVAAPAFFDLTNSYPGVISILLAGANPSNAASVDFTVTFNSSVSGVDASDFIPTVTGISGTAVSSVNGSGSAYLVTVGTGSGDGTLRLDLVDDDSIQDSLGQPLGGSGVGNGDYTGGEEYTIDKTPPATELINMPSDPTHATDASFTFISSEGGATFECALDSAAFSACTSPAAYSSLAEGPHSFQVRAVDLAGNLDPTPATYGWNIDSTPPDTFITGAPSNPTNSHEASFNLSASEAGASFVCALDGSAYSACSSPVVYSSLAEGQHDFQVRASDLAGNTDPTPAGFSWLIDTIALSIQITSHPSNPTNRTEAAFTLDISDGSGSGVMEAACWIDGESPVDCVSGSFTETVGEGSHTFHVEAEDNAGNQSAASYTWIVDLSGPTSSPYSLGPWQNSLSFDITWSGSDTLTSIETYDVQVQEGAGSWSDWLTQTTQTSASFTGQEAVTYTFRVRAVDIVGNIGEWSAGVATTVDTIPPSANLASLPPLVFGGFTAAWSGSDETSGVATYDVEFQIDGGAWTSWLSGTDQVLALFTPSAGHDYAFRVRAVDEAGNTGVWSTPVSTHCGAKLYLPLIVRDFSSSS